jgi:hypothetical protein
VQRGFLYQEQASCRGFQVLAPANFLNAGPTALGSSKKAEFVLACCQFVQPNSDLLVVIWPQFFRRARGLPSSRPPKGGHCMELVLMVERTMSLPSCIASYSGCLQDIGFRHIRGMSQTKNTEDRNQRISHSATCSSRGVEDLFDPRSRLVLREVRWGASTARRGQPPAVGWVGRHGTTPLGCERRVLWGAQPDRANHSRR